MKQFIITAAILAILAFIAFRHVTPNKGVNNAFRQFLRDKGVPHTMPNDSSDLGANCTMMATKDYYSIAKPYLDSLEQLQQIIHAVAFNDTIGPSCRVCVHADK